MYFDPSPSPQCPYCPLIMSTDEVAVSLSMTLPQHTGDMEALQEELERLNREIIEANEDRAKAAEYGIVLLDQKQALQSQNEELTALFDTTKRELETAVEVRGGDYMHVAKGRCTVDIQVYTCLELYGRFELN